MSGIAPVAAAPRHAVATPKDGKSATKDAPFAPSFGQWAQVVGTSAGLGVAGVIFGAFVSLAGGSAGMGSGAVPAAAFGLVGLAIGGFGTYHALKSDHLAAQR